MKKYRLATKYVHQSAQHKLTHEGIAVNMIKITSVKVHNHEVFTMKILSHIAITWFAIETF